MATIDATGKVRRTGHDRSGRGPVMTCPRDQVASIMTTGTDLINQTKFRLYAMSSSYDDDVPLSSIRRQNPRASKPKKVRTEKARIGADALLGMIQNDNFSLNDGDTDESPETPSPLPD